MEGLIVNLDVIVLGVIFVLGFMFMKINCEVVVVWLVILDIYFFFEYVWFDFILLWLVVWSLILWDSV